MKFVTEFRDPKKARQLASAIHQATTRSWRIMEICGGQTHSILRFGINQLLPSKITLIHGPGCPVCVTPLEMIDFAIEIAKKPQTILCVFGDMMRVPGSKNDLISAKAQGHDIRMIYSPLDVLAIAQQNPKNEVVFFAVGFETTAPATAITLLQAQKKKIRNFSVLSAHVLVPPAIKVLLEDSETQIQGFLAAGHVCTVTGYKDYQSIAQKFSIPIVIAGFEPIDLLGAILKCVQLLEKGVNAVVNQYARSVRPEGNLEAQKMMKNVFEIVDRKWRGIGEIPQSGLALRPKFSSFDAIQRFNLPKLKRNESSECIAGQILKGIKSPEECPAFGTRCNPENPLGAPMVSSEGACAAYYKYRNRK